MRFYAVPRLRDIVFLSIFGAALLLGPRMLNADGDLPHHLVMGKYVLQGNFPPLTDVFSYTRNGIPFAPHKWLSGVLFYLAYLIFDERGIVILSSVLLAAIFTFIYSDGVTRTGSRLPTFLLVIAGAMVSSLHWISRPHLFSMLLLALWLIFIERLSSGRKAPIWVFAVLMLLWNNLHGEFIVGFLVTAAFLAGWVWEFIFDRSKVDLLTGKRLGLVLLVISIVTLINPVSFRALSTVSSWLANDYLMSHTQETLPPDFSDPKFLMVLIHLLFSIVLMALKKGNIPARMAFILAGFSALVLLSTRNVHLYGVAAPFVLVTVFSKQQLVNPLLRLEEFFEKIETQLKGIVWPLLTVFVGIILLVITPLGRTERFSPVFFPINAAEWLKSNPQSGNLFNPFDWGGYLSLELWPGTLVFIDSQGDVYGEDFIREYEQIISLGEQWQALLAKYHVDWGVLPESWPLAGALIDAGWQTVYADGTAIILVRGK